MREWQFRSRLIEWRGPAPFFYAPLPADVAAEIAAVRRQASYGWGVIPVNASVAPGGGRERDGGAVDFETSLFPRDGTYLLPLKVAVRQRLGVTLGDEVAVTMSVGGRIREPSL